MNVFQETNALIDRITVVQHLRWDSLLSFRLCELGDEGKWKIDDRNKPEYVPFLVGDEFSSVSDVAETLQQMVLCYTNEPQSEMLQVAQDKGMCVVLSTRSSAYF